MKLVEDGFAHLRGDLTEVGHFLREPLDLILAEVPEHFRRRVFAEKEHDDGGLCQTAEHGLNGHLALPFVDPAAEQLCHVLGLLRTDGAHASREDGQSP